MDFTRATSQQTNLQGEFRSLERARRQHFEGNLSMVMLYRSSTLTVTASWRDGDLLIYGQDLGPGMPTGDEYEYWLTVPATSCT